MAKKIIVIDTPPGEAPEWVREAFVGLELEISRPINPREPTGLCGGKTDPLNDDGYTVDARTTLELMSVTNPKAAQWIADNAPLTLSGNAHFVIGKDFCLEQ